ncbi:MAG: YfhL family 4Fe-4S dicluster ferredoxin [Actinomycetota bacterium]|nr:YfhL family 4Fe-4S dicluster ferredoxin [Actinomycetota bacterium]
MAIMITDECISCHACEPECPNSAIAMGEDRYEIDPQLCTECVGFSDSPQCAYVCPIDVCIDDPERRESEDDLFARALRVHPDQADRLTLSPSTSHFRT